MPNLVDAFAAQRVAGQLRSALRTFLPCMAALFIVGSAGALAKPPSLATGGGPGFVDATEALGIARALRPQPPIYERTFANSQEIER